MLAWRADEAAANGTDKGCFDVDLGRWKDVTEKLEARVLHIKGAGDKADAEALKAEFVDAKDDWAKARDVIRERYLRAPQGELRLRHRALTFLTAPAPPHDGGDGLP